MPLTLLRSLAESCSCSILSPRSIIFFMILPTIPFTPSTSSEMRSWIVRGPPPPPSPLSSWLSSAVSYAGRLPSDVWLRYCPFSVDELLRALLPALPISSTASREYRRLNSAGESMSGERSFEPTPSSRLTDSHSRRRSESSLFCCCAAGSSISRVYRCTVFMKRYAASRFTPGCVDDI
ncbi:hypothetical protein DFJ73DRAFT_828212 [Zopfochytrium polystomum]|nr:hypothetical protein DFJ73DRAFT_828212 [Zopfochytrium polystomum]